ncbi:MAG: hypothetical protein KZQ81_17280 [Candidatus Thiodiazotropha sp. (ex Rostrolucina anterorostrata)]|nr:hypothetical protein [Candidatus Thiodiazotropha sp. (ex Rostrolucina anterorostrata)]
MKTKHLIGMLVMGLLAAVTAWMTIPAGLGVVFQSISVYTALFLGVIALSAADPLPKTIVVDTDVHIGTDEKSTGTYPKGALKGVLPELYENHDDPVLSRRVYFHMTNTSGFTLKKPVLTFRLPSNRKHPEGEANTYTRIAFNSNLFNCQTDLVSLEDAEEVILSNSRLPYWNNNEPMDIWIRMMVEDRSVNPFSIVVSVNAENAEGVTTTINIDSDTIKKGGD